MVHGAERDIYIYRREFYSTVTALRWAAFWTLAPCPMRYRRCQRVGTDCPAAWGMPEVHGEGIRSERRFGRWPHVLVTPEVHRVEVGMSAGLWAYAE